MTGAVRSGCGRPGQQDFGAKVGLDLRAGVPDLLRHAERYAGDAGGGSWGSLGPCCSRSAAPTSGLPE